MKKQKVIFWGFAITLAISFASLIHMNINQYENAPLENYQTERANIG